VLTKGCDWLGALQVRFLYETFRRMRPGVPLMALYGKQKQMKRMAIYNDFCKVWPVPGLFCPRPDHVEESANVLAGRGVEMGKFFPSTCAASA
jgi:hypothetical protein